MKVLKPGREQTGWSSERVCTGAGNGGGGCGAKLLVEEKDLFLMHSYVHVDHDVFVTFRCIQCGVLTDINDCPSGVRSRIPKSQKEWEARRTP